VPPTATYVPVPKSIPVQVVLDVNVPALQSTISSFEVFKISTSVACKSLTIQSIPFLELAATEVFVIAKKTPFP
jgi:hypothetical protein